MFGLFIKRKGIPKHKYEMYAKNYTNGTENKYFNSIFNVLKLAIVCVKF